MFARVFRQRAWLRRLIFGWAALVTVLPCRSNGAIVYDVIPGPFVARQRCDCIDGTNQCLTLFSTAVDFVISYTNSNPETDSPPCTVTNITGGFIESFVVSPSSIPAGGGFMVFKFFIRQFPGATNVTLESPCFSYTVSLPDPSLPRVLSSPVDTNISAGTTACFTVQACSADGYQWQKDGVNLTNQDRITGATSPTLCLTDIAPDDAGFYQVMLTNPSGSIISPGAQLSLNSTPTLRLLPSAPASGFSFTVLGARDLNYALQAATDLTLSDWVSLVTNTAPFTYTELSPTNFPARFYRACWVP